MSEVMSLLIHAESGHLVKRKVNPGAQSTFLQIFHIASVECGDQLNTLTPVGIAMIMVAGKKYARMSRYSYCKNI